LVTFFQKINCQRKKQNCFAYHRQRPEPSYIPFSFTNQDGKTITSNDVKGKICVVVYFYATCKGICPKMNENLSKVYTAFKGNKKVMILSAYRRPNQGFGAGIEEL
jgi:cytochrome oxidase Cu insertion factor (SCO1/SenC/PrrC family)